jgi:phage shock protein E
MDSIHHDELKRIIEANEDGLIIDVRARERYEQGHIPGSINLPFLASDFAEEVALQVVDRRTRIVLYGDSADADAPRRAATVLEDAGCTQVQVFESGLEAWIGHGHSLVTGIAAL